MVIRKLSTNSTCGDRVEQRKPSYKVLMNLNLQELQKTLWGLSKLLNKNRVGIWFGHSTPVQVEKTEFQKTRASQHSVQHCLQYPGMEATAVPIVRWTENDVAHVNYGGVLSPKEGWNDAIGSHLNGPRHDHTKWSNSDWERQILYEITYSWNPKTDTNNLCNTRRLTGSEPMYDSIRGNWSGRDEVGG